MDRSSCNKSATWQCPWDRSKHSCQKLLHHIQHLETHAEKMMTSCFYITVSNTIISSSAKAILRPFEGHAHNTHRMATCTADLQGKADDFCARTGHHRVGRLLNTQTSHLGDEEKTESVLRQLRQEHVCIVHWCDVNHQDHERYTAVPDHTTHSPKGTPGCNCAQGVPRECRCWDMWLLN